MNTPTLDDCNLLGISINCTLLSDRFLNVRKPLEWLCDNCGKTFMESYINIKMKNRGCLSCAYKKFNKKNKK